MIKKKGEGNISKAWDNSKESVNSKNIKSSQDGRDKVSKRGNFSTDGKADFNILSSREKEVLKLLSEGCTNKETAKRLNISVRTVETHRKNIMEKINVKNLAGLIKYSIANKLILLD